MFLSKIVLKTFDKNVFRDVGDEYKMHQFVMSAFPNNMKPERILWRREEYPSRDMLIQSETQPDWGKAQAKVGYIENSKVKSFDFKYTKGDVLSFRLVANPTYTKNGKVLTFFGSDDIVNWLIRKAEAGGFVIKRITFTSNNKSTTQTKNITHGSVRFDGLLVVKDAQLFINSLQNGIGRSKAFGCGLLSVCYAK